MEIKDYTLSKQNIDSIIEGIESIYYLAKERKDKIGLAMPNNEVLNEIRNKAHDLRQLLKSEA